MWETIKEVLTSDNSWIILLFVGFIILLILRLIKKGYLNITTKAVRMGNNSENERNIIRRQIDYAHKYCTGIMGNLFDDYNDYKIKYVFERVYDEIIKWITLNNMHKSVVYIEYRQNDIWNLLNTLQLEEKYKTESFKKEVNEYVKTLIEQLVDIRENYKYG